MAKRITEDGEILDEVSREIIARVPPMWKTGFNHDTDAESLATGLECKDPSKTQQQFAKEADINHILAKFNATNVLPTIGEARYEDLADEEVDFQNRMVTSWEVEQAWQQLTPEQRNTLKNPATMVEYVDHCLQTGDFDDLVKLGLATKKTPPAPAPVAPDPATPPAGGTPAPAGANAGTAAPGAATT